MDPFAHHPELRSQVTPAEESFFRDFTAEKMLDIQRQNNQPPFPYYDDATREATRAAALAGRMDRDLWVFAYGSLMWNPALQFAELRRAFAPGYARRFILLDTYGARGTVERPGLMAALDHGAGCAGLAYRVAAENLDHETEILWRREMVGPGYHAVFVPIDIDGTGHEALTFLADHDSDMIAGDLTPGQIVEFIATGTGFLGSSFEYLANIISHLHVMGIPDPDLDALFDEVRAYRSSEGVG